MKIVRFISAFFLTAVIFFSWGFSSAEYNVFPGVEIKKITNEVIAYLQGGDANKKSIKEKIVNDIGWQPERMLVNSEIKTDRDYRPIEIIDLKKRRSLPVVFIDSKDAFPPGYLLIWGAFDFKRHLHGGILMDETGRMLHSWVPDENALISEIQAYNAQLENTENRIQYKPLQHRFPHGVTIFPDGSLLFNDGDSGNGMQKIDYCSNVLWVKLGQFNHAISKQDNGSTVWTIDTNTGLHKIDSITGDSLQYIHIEDVIAASPKCNILSIPWNPMTGTWCFDPWHFNDVEPLPEKYNHAYPEFNPGDLLVSSRTINAIMIIDPALEKIKWWRAGIAAWQHDPDWQKNGRITIFNNHTRGIRNSCNSLGAYRFSQVISVYPANYDTDVLYDGGKDDFYSNIRGKHQILPNGNILITSAMQGRILIVTPNGKTVFEFCNRYDNNKAMILSEAIWLPHNFFNFDIKDQTCSGEAGNTSKWRAGQNQSLHYCNSRLKFERDILHTKAFTFGTSLPFSNNPFLTFAGWSYAEPEFRWSDGKKATLHFKPPQEMQNETISVHLSIHTLGRQTIQVYCNGHSLTSFDVALSTAEERMFEIPFSVLKPNRINVITFVFPEARRPDSTDQRILAMALHGIKFEQQE